MTYTKFRASDLWDVEAISPTLGSDHNGQAVVTVENCIYYLSLLEQFAKMLTKFKDHLDAFHARAEKRYHLWVAASERRAPVTVMVPPLDVAYMIHAHLLTPHRFVEDAERLDNKMMDYPMPLKELVKKKAHTYFFEGNATYPMKKKKKKLNLCSTLCAHIKISRQQHQKTFGNIAVALLMSRLLWNS